MWRIAAAVCVLLAGCSQVQTSDLIAPSPETTIKYRLDTAAAETEWTQTLEPELSEREPLHAEADVTAQTVFAVKTEEEPVYPFIPGFGSLDTRALGAAQEQCVRGFCGALLSGEHGVLAEFMAAGMEYQLFVFLYNIRGIPALRDYLLGKPFITDGTYMTPVRFYTEQAPLDIDLFLVQEEDRWRIQQIYMRKAEHE